jgi:phenylpropionate dioxygenase-like ring-hydroxylating dioxygenase large terminal subunit
MFIRNCWYVAAWSHELPAGEIIARSIINEPLAIFRTENGEVVVMADRCCHRAAPLSMGKLEGNAIRCAYHGFKFDHAGACTEVPGQDNVPAKARVATYPAIERHNWIWVWMGDVANADPDLIPAACGFDDPRWNLRGGQMDYAANYLLINDNLTDFSHLSYVHVNSFGASEAWARIRPKITRLPRGIRVQRWLRSEDSNLKGVRAGGDELWSSYDFLAPGILLMRAASYDTGTAAAHNGGEPGPDIPCHNENFTSQAVTALTDSSSRYFFSWGPRAGEDSDKLAEILKGIAIQAFTEDRIIIEAQQRSLDQCQNFDMVLSSADVGPVQFRSVIEQLIKAEGGTARLRL